jgi:hypothetical protein
MLRHMQRRHNATVRASLLPDADGVVLMDTPAYPSEYRSFSLAHRAALDILGESELAWVAASPTLVAVRGVVRGHGVAAIDVLRMRVKRMAQLLATTDLR